MPLIRGIGGMWYLTVAFMPRRGKASVCLTFLPHGVGRGIVNHGSVWDAMSLQFRGLSAGRHRDLSGRRPGMTGEMGFRDYLELKCYN